MRPLIIILHNSRVELFLCLLQQMIKAEYSKGGYLVLDIIPLTRLLHLQRTAAKVMEPTIQ